MPLDELEKSEKGGEVAWKGAEGPLGEMAALLKENGGPFFMGKEGWSSHGPVLHPVSFRSGTPCMTAATTDFIRASGLMNVVVSYADFVFVGLLQFLKCLGQDIFDRVTAMDKAFPASYEACSPWLERDHH